MFCTKKNFINSLGKKKKKKFYIYCIFQHITGASSPPHENIIEKSAPHMVKITFWFSLQLLPIGDFRDVVLVKQTEHHP